MNDAESILLEALELAPSQRPSFLDQACGGNAALRAKVDAMLARSAGADDFFGETSVGGTEDSRAQPGLEKAGDHIDHYKLLQEIGEGGCGTVYMAEQEEPVRRKVALKIIKPGMDTREVIARFEAERQALAMMDHPNIARVYDAGTTSTGRPYFVMELVRGLKITEFCDQQNLSTHQRLELFLKVCSAVQHAHQKGIIHRDLKPSNILVTLVDGAPAPKVIDFGIAKATNQERLTDKTFFTAFEQFIGTPAYMSPEQADISGVDIDTRSDIYSLGVVLYELLTGRTPFDAKELLKSGLEGIRRTLKEQEPPKPSTQLNKLLGSDLTTTATSRHTDPARLVKQVSGDLDWVVMKCLEKDRGRRYETANGLAADIKRHLDSEPVVARPPSAGYRFRTFARRNKVALSVAAMIAIILITATIVSVWQAIRATKAEGKVTALLLESEARQKQLEETVQLLTESTTELSSHMRRFMIGNWEMHFKLERVESRQSMSDLDWKLFNEFSKLFIGDVSSRLQFLEDGSVTGETVVPTLFQAMTPTLDKKRVLDGRWELVKQQGKKTTIKTSERGMAGIRQSSEFTITVVNSDTILLEDTRFEGKPMKPIITFKRIPL